MRLHVILLLASLAGILLGGALIAPWALGLAIMIDSAAVGVYALFHDDGQGPAGSQPQVYAFGGSSLNDVLDRARAAA